MTFTCLIYTSCPWEGGWEEERRRMDEEEGERVKCQQQANWVTQFLGLHCSPWVSRLVIIRITCLLFHLSPNAHRASLHYYHHEHCYYSHHEYNESLALQVNFLHVRATLHCAAENRLHFIVAIAALSATTARDERSFAKLQSFTRLIHSPDALLRRPLFSMWVMDM